MIQEKNLEETMQRIKEASLKYLKTVTKKNYPDDLLNRPASKEYWLKLIKLLKKKVEEKKKID